MIQNWKLALIALLFMVLFTSLGIWQLSRANEKKMLLQTYTQRTKLAPLTANLLSHPGDWRFYRATLTGTFDPAHTFLLDNKIHAGKIGYEVYTLFKVAGFVTPILIDRGFIPLGPSRKVLPQIRTPSGRITLTGMLNFPPAYVSFGKITDSPIHLSPLRVEYIRLDELSALIKHPLFAYILNISPENPAAYAIEWQIVTMKPEKHVGYAIQWFAFAFTLLILFVTLNRPRTHF